MKTSITTVSLSGDLRDKLEAIAAAGFDGVEIFENDFLSFDAAPREVGRMVRDAGLVVTTFQPFRDFEGMPEPQRARVFDRAERKFDLMGELGADLLLVCSNVSPAALGGIDRAAADFRELGERAAKRGLKVGFEALAWGRHVNDHRDAWEVVRRAGHPNIGLILDSFHTLARGIDPDSIRAIPADRIFLVQLADAPRLEMDLLSWSRHFRNLPGQGDLPVTAFIEAVAATGYDGVYSLEIFNDHFRAGPARSVAIDGRRSLLQLADTLERRKPAVERARPLLPERARCLGVEFVEFAVDEAGAIELEALFAGLGFARRGRHRSKDVTLWSQGGIALLVNREKEGYAHAAYIMHGPAACAICLKVDDARAATARAGALLATGFRQEVGPGELEIPAIRGVGGSLIYLVDPGSELARWREIDFVPVDDGAAPEAGLARIDHLSQSMQYDEMLSWLLFYGSIFDLEKTPELEIPDPAGLVRSQVVQNAEGTLRIVLNASQSQRTLSARFRSEFFGSGIQHIALETDDIFAAAARMRQDGVRFLPIPANYHDDIEARFGLEPELVDRLREAGILYDRDGGGEFFQLYTTSFADRFFFEIVQRRGYAGFGAANAPIRLAAQTRLAPDVTMPRR
ncbi:bifunctional sugar phosphate isomerase/epimerase/4-hydroxyphenylpyruvate dioxygenase family protein [Inquilinus sp. Marseille-Q2685]|uniref:bifunctional sugar phosphate isomerase/epimerase/4-hydroxyphenylpyruvate dioxygenase family protein n=1 Tax=Inquilinus sp. Marseille-Q2685 TaxID=2866581 RepID=UPI001CE3BC88|nr:sugar phosphate isomerase/epimerase and 4-hydroxyphenylpyruvate domain-containing protein [Inquilinus sp. Marseille-Q2685]